MDLTYNINNEIITAPRGRFFIRWIMIRRTIDHTKKWVRMIPTTERSYNIKGEIEIPKRCIGCDWLKIINEIQGYCPFQHCIRTPEDLQRIEYR